MTNLTEIEKKALDFNNDLEKVKKELKRLQSLKCNLKKNKFQKDYDLKMTSILQQEQIMKEVRALLEPKDKTVPTFTKDDVELLDYDQTLKAIKSIQSKKYHTKYLTEVECDNDEYRQACQIEEWLQDRKSRLQPTSEHHIRKTDVQTVIDTIESTGKISTERILEMLKELIK